MEIGRNNFDEQLKKALKGLEDGDHRPDWEIFEKKLEAAESELNDEALDGLVMAGLADFEVAFDPSSWEALEERLTDEQIQEDTQIDDLARQNLTNFEAPYKKSHWEIMAERLEEEFSLRRRIYRYKVMEVALMLLFIFTLVNYLPMGGNKMGKLKSFHFDLFQAGDTPAEEIDKTFGKETPTQGDAPKERDDRPSAHPIAEASITGEAIENGLKGAQQVIQNNWTNTAPAARPNRLVPATIPGRASVVKSQHKESIFIGLEKFDLDKNSLISEDLEEQSMHSVLNALDLPEAEMLDFNHVLPSMILVPVREKGMWRLGMAGDFEANYIFSPDNEELGSSRDTTLGFGYGGGLIANYKRKRWGFEIGALYNHKSYPPNFINQFNPDNNPNILESEYFKDIQLDLLQVPLNIQYYMMDQPKWRVYASTGLTVNMLLSPVYKIRETRAALVTMPNPAPPGGQPDNSLKNKTEFPAGILEGGGLKDNSYMTANFGLGVERSVGYRWSIFAQPNYQHQISKEGLKPFKDKFYTLSMLIGAKVIIK